MISDSPTTDWVYLLDRMAVAIGALTVILGGLWGVWKAARPRLTRWAKDRILLSAENIERMQSSIEQVRAKTLAMVHIHGDAIYICTPDGSNVWVSDPLADMFDLTPDQMKGNGWAAHIIYEDRMREIQHWKECVATNSPYHARYAIEVEDKRKLIETEAWPHKNHEGEILFWVGYARERGMVVSSVSADATT